ncbi:MAG: DUF4340 domain-containing protein [Pseudomonadota bacterium]|nr:DUF4340 domain-containing protein [Pseudomonadota bacterium]
MSPRIALILVILLAVLGGGALLYQQQERARRPQNIGSLGQLLFKDLKAADIAAIRIVEPKQTLTLQRKDDGWVIAEREDFPADLAKVREFVIKAIGLKVGQSEPIGEADRARLNLDASGAQVEFNAADGKPLAKLTAGKKYFKRELDNPDKAPGDGRFVVVPGETKLVYIVSDPLTQASAKSADWIDRGVLRVEKVKALELRYPDGGGWRIERSGDNADWKLAGARPGEKLDVSRANAATYSLSLLELADVMPKDAKMDAKDSGLDKPTLINATTLAGVDYGIKVGKLAGENYYVALVSSSDQPRDKLLAQHVLLVPKSKLEDTLKKRAELLEKQDEKK